MARPARPLRPFVTREAGSLAAGTPVARTVARTIATTPEHGRDSQPGSLGSLGTRRRRGDVLLAHPQLLRLHLRSGRQHRFGRTAAAHRRRNSAFEAVLDAAGARGVLAVA